MRNTYASQHNSLETSPCQKYIVFLKTCLLKCCVMVSNRKTSQPLPRTETKMKQWVSCSRLFVPNNLKHYLGFKNTCQAERKTSPNVRNIPFGFDSRSSEEQAAYLCCEMYHALKHNFFFIVGLMQLLLGFILVALLLPIFLPHQSACKACSKTQES